MQVTGNTILIPPPPPQKKKKKKKNSNVRINHEPDGLLNGDIQS